MEQRGWALGAQRGWRVMALRQSGLEAEEAEPRVGCWGPGLQGSWFLQVQAGRSGLGSHWTQSVSAQMGQCL